MTHKHSISAEAEHRRHTHGSSHPTLRPIGNNAIFVNQPTISSANELESPPTAGFETPSQSLSAPTNPPSPPPSTTVQRDNELFNEVVKKFDETLNSLPTVAVLKLGG
jgi:hypothetical protein